MFRTLSAAMLGALLCVASAGARMPSDPAGFWTGRGRAVRTANLDVVTITTTYTSEFWFVAAADHTVKGEAVVTYELGFNDAKLRARLAQANAAGSAMLRATPTFGGLLDLGMTSRDAIGMRMSYNERTPLRRGAISGSIKNGRLSLRWSPPPAPIPYQKYVIYPLKERPMTPATHPAYSPWLGEATIAEPLPGQLVATASRNSSTVRHGEVIFVTTWAAERRSSRSGSDPRTFRDEP